MQGKIRFQQEKLTKLLSLFPVVAVVGPRQCGKSTLVQTALDNWKYYDLERPDHYRLITDDPLGFFQRNNSRIIIDEAQQYPKLFEVLRTVIDDDRNAAGRFVLTGSSSPQLVHGLSESLAGRIATIELGPFKTAEYFDQPLPDLYRLLTSTQCTVSMLTELNTAITVNNVHEHWLFGGYPEPRIKDHSGEEYHQLWMDGYFSSYITKDIQRLFPRLNIHAYRKLITCLSFHSGTILNKSLISRALEVSSVTVNEYLEILHGTFIWRNLRSYEGNSLKKVQKMPKGFFRDSGVLHHLLKVNTTDNLMLHPAAGPSFESFVIEELIRGLQCTMKAGTDFYFYRTRDGAEVDLIIDSSFGTIPVEIKSGTKINKRALSSLKSFMKDVDTPFGIIINNSDRIELLANNIVLIPARYI